MDQFLFTERDFKEADDLAAKAAQAYVEVFLNQKMYEGLCKDALAAIKMGIREQFSKEDHKISESELECRARATEEWKTFRQGIIEDWRRAERKRLEYENRKRRWETIRSYFSHKKAEMRIQPGT